MERYREGLTQTVNMEDFFFGRWRLWVMGSCSSESPTLYSKRCFGALASPRFELPLRTLPGRCTIRRAIPWYPLFASDPSREGHPSPWHELLPPSPPGKCTIKWEGCTLLKNGGFFAHTSPQKELQFSLTRKDCSTQSKTVPARQVWVQ